MPNVREINDPGGYPAGMGDGDSQEAAGSVGLKAPDVDKAVRALMYTLASALAPNFDEARRLGCTDLLLVTTNVVSRRARN